MASWGEGVVEQLAHFIARGHPEIEGFIRASLFRMRQLYGTYRDDEKVASLVRQLVGARICSSWLSRARLDMARPPSGINLDGRRI
jgi:Protein of unknown function (DUF1016).